MLLKENIKEFLSWIRNTPFYECGNPIKLNEKLCLLGRHDYEFVEMTPDGALLRCFYCEHEKVTNLKTQKS